MLVNMMGIIAVMLEADALSIAATIMASRIAVRPALMVVITASSFVAAIIAASGAVIPARTFVVTAIGFIAKVSARVVFELAVTIARGPRGGCSRPLSPLCSLLPAMR